MNKYIKILSNFPTQDGEKETDLHLPWPLTASVVLPDLDRKKLIYWNSEAGRVIDAEKLFEENEFEPETDDPENESTKTRPSAHKLPVEDEFLVVFMKLKNGPFLGKTSLHVFLDKS